MPHFSEKEASSIPHFSEKEASSIPHFSEKEAWCFSSHASTNYCGQPGYDMDIRGTKWKTRVRYGYPGYEIENQGTKWISGVRNGKPGYEMDIRGTRSDLKGGYERKIQT